MIAVTTTLVHHGCATNYISDERPRSATDRRTTGMRTEQLLICYYFYKQSLFTGVLQTKTINIFRTYVSSNINLFKPTCICITTNECFQVYCTKLVSVGRYSKFVMVCRPVLLLTIASTKFAFYVEHP